MSDFLSRIQQMLRGDLAPPSIAQTLGFTLREASDGRAVFVMTTRMDRHANPMGTLHGGVLCDIADAAMGTAYGTLLDPGESFTTLELKINFVRPVWETTITATGRVVQRGKSVGLTECDVVDDQGRLVARASSTCLTLRGDQARGR